MSSKQVVLSGIVLVGLAMAALIVINYFSPVGSTDDSVRHRVISIDNLPDLFITQFQEACEGTEEACDFARFSQPDGVHMVNYSYIGGECPRFEVPAGIVAEYEAAPPGFTSWVRLAQGPVNLGGCQIDFHSNVGFTCTRPGIKC